MSYNVTMWKTKRIDNLCIPVASLYKSERKDWHPKREEFGDLCTNLSTLGLEIVGVTAGRDGQIEVTSIDCYGEGSGSSLYYILGPALKDSTGLLEAVLIWEGGDSIQRLTVQDGMITWEGVEL